MKTCSRAFLMAALALLVTSGSAWAGIDSIADDLTSRALNISSSTLSGAIKLFSALIMLQWFMSHWKTIFNGDALSILAKVTGSLLWVIFCSFLFSNPAGWVQSIYDWFAHFSPITLSADLIMNVGIRLTKNIFAALGENGLTDMLLNIGPALMIVFCAIVVFLTFVYLAISIVMVKIELAMVITVTPVSFALLGLNATRDTGIAPLKSAMSLGIRALILGVIATLIESSAVSWMTDFAKIAQDNLDPIYAAAGGSLVFIALVFNAGKIASAIASGSASFSGNEGVAAAMQVANTAAMGTAAMASAAKAMTDVGAKLGNVVGSKAGSAMESMGDRFRGNNMKNAGASAFNDPASQQMASDILSGMSDTSQGESGSAGSQSSPDGEPARYDQTASGRPAAPVMPESVQAAKSTEAAPSASPMGNGSTASIGGAEQATTSTQNQNNNQKEKPSAWDHLKDAAGHSKRTVEEGLQGDSASVSVSVNAHAGGHD